MNRKVTIDWTREESDEEVTYRIEADVSPVIPAKLYGPPENCYPAEGGEVEIIAVTRDGKPVELALSEKEQREVDDLLCDAAERDVPDPPDPDDACDEDW